MSEFQKDILIMLLSPIFLILVGTGLASYILDEDIKTVLLSFQNMLIPISIFFGGLGLVGCYGVFKYGNESLWNLELKDDWPITKKHTFKIVVVFNFVALLLGVFPFIMGGMDGLLEYAFIITVFGLGTLLLLLILFVGITISYQRVLRNRS